MMLLCAMCALAEESRRMRPGSVGTVSLSGEPAGGECELCGKRAAVLAEDGRG